MMQSRSSPEVPPAGRTTGARWRKPAIAVAFAIYFFLVSRDTPWVPFTADEVFAIHVYWHPSPWRLLTSQFLLWHGYFRPTVGLFCVPTFLAFGLNPVPYHVGLLLLLLVGAYQMYRFARVLGCDELPAAMVALIACYHGGLSNVYYTSVYVSDVLCGIFCLVAFVYYAGIRASGRLLTRGQTAAFLGLYLLALNAKEMAVTMPVVLLAYEWLYHGPPRGPWRNVALWLRGQGQVLCWAGLLNVVYIYGRTFGQHGLMKNPGYAPVYSWERFADFQERYLGDLFYHLPRFGWFATCAIWLLVTYLAWRRNRPLLRLCWFWMVVTPLPIMFLFGRDQACLYVTLAGWAVFAAALFMDWLPGATRVVAAEPVFRRLGHGRVRAMLAAAAMLVWALGSWSYKETYVTATAMSELEQRVFEVLAQFRAMNPRVPPGAKVVFLDDPFSAFDMAFIAELWFRDRGTRVYLNRITPLPQEQIASADAIFTWRDGKLIRVR